MATFSNTMNLTNSSLTTISRELINKRVYKSGILDVIGAPSILNGIASNISDENYFRKLNIPLAPDYTSTQITIEGSLGTMDSTITCCAWEMFGKESNLALYITETSVFVKKDEAVLISITNLNNSHATIKCSLTLTENSCNLSVISKGKLSVNSILLTNKIAVEKINNIIVGTSSLKNREYFYGDLDLASLTIYQNEKILFTPSAENNFIFTDILVGDGTFPLTNNSSAILNHIFSFPVKEITRTNNNILLTATISEEAKLNIKEIGLYAKDELGRHLFSLISDLNLLKSPDLDYNLVINAKIDINVVNINVFPEIVINKPNYPSFKDFDTVQKVYLYAITNLERMIKLNALGVGNYAEGAMNFPEKLDVYTESNESTTQLPSTIRGVGLNTPQVYYRKQDEINTWEDNFCATLNFANLTNKYFGTDIVEVFNPILVQTYGDFKLSNTGEGSNIGGPGYATPLTFDPNKFNEWKIKVQFKTGEIQEDQTILNLKNSSSSNQPFTLKVNNEQCRLVLYESDYILIGAPSEDSDIPLKRSEKIEVINNVTFYGWISESDQEYFTTQKNPDEHDNLYNSNGEIEVNIEVKSRINAAQILNSALFRVRRNSSYTVEIKFDGRHYKVTYYDPNIDKQQEVLNFTSSRKIGRIDNIIFSSLYDTQTDDYIEPFEGILLLNNFTANFYDYSDFGELLNVQEVTFNDKEEIFHPSLTDFYHIPEYNHSYFTINNLTNLNSAYSLEVLENYLKGRNDNINLGSPNGASLCVKADLSQISFKPEEGTTVLLAKGDLEAENFYFVLKIEGNKVIFEYYTETGNNSLVYEIPEEEIRSFSTLPVTFTFVISGSATPVISLYKDIKLLVTKQIGNRTTLDPHNYYLTNQLSFDFENVHNERMIKEIIALEGTLESSDVYYLCTTLNTNF